jgi:hypothetical protein
VAESDTPALTEPVHLSRPFFYREPANGVTLAVTYQGSDGLAFVAQPHRDADQPYEQYGVVLPRDVVRSLALRMLASIGSNPTVDQRVVEHAIRMSGGSMQVRFAHREIERIFPLVDWIKSEQRFGGKVYRRVVVVVEDWEEVERA